MSLAEADRPGDSRRIGGGTGTSQVGVLIMAKAPVAGQVKTRLGTAIGPVPAAQLAAAALLDTLNACEGAFGPGRRVLAMAGDLSSAERAAEVSTRLDNWTVIEQRGCGLGERLASAHRDAARLVGGPVVQVGMDTPQLSAATLAAVLALFEADDAVLGLAEDGGWWVLGLKHLWLAEGLVDVPMSSPATGSMTHRMLTEGGAGVSLAPGMRDVDDYHDAVAISRSAPHTRFAKCWRSIHASFAEGSLHGKSPHHSTRPAPALSKSSPRVEAAC